MHLDQLALVAIENARGFMVLLFGLDEAVHSFVVEVLSVLDLGKLSLEVRLNDLLTDVQIVKVDSILALVQLQVLRLVVWML